MWTKMSIRNKSFYYNRKKDICILGKDCYSQIKDICNNTNVSLWIFIELNHYNFKDILLLLIDCGFSDPYLSDKTPMNEKIPLSVALIKDKKGHPYDKYTIIYKVAHIIQQYKENKKSCSMYARFNEKAINFLIKASKSMGYKGDTQKEITGQFEIDEIIKIGDKFVYNITVLDNSIGTGDNENVDVKNTRYNFHSHPEQAYKKYGVKYAWPSLTDYLGYLDLVPDTIFHCVAALEGLYIVSLTKHWTENYKKIDKKFIKKHYDYELESKLTPVEYVKKINSIKYKGYPIFNVIYLHWEIVDTIFKVDFAPFGKGICIMSEKIAENYKKLHKRV